MKGKPITFRPRQDLRERLDNLAAALDRSHTWVIEKAVEGALPGLEEKYEQELRELEKKASIESPYSIRRSEVALLEDAARVPSPTKKKRAA